MENENKKSNDNIVLGMGFFLFVSLMFVFFSGEPDLIDALIQFLTSHCAK